MIQTTSSSTAKRQRLTRTAMLRATRGDRGPAIALRTGRLHGITMCERCAAVFQNKRWRKRPRRKNPCRSAWRGRVPRLPAGGGRRVLRARADPRRSRAPSQDEIRRHIQAVAERAAYTQTERRIVSVELVRDGLEVLTTLPEAGPPRRARAGQGVRAAAPG